MVRLHVVWVRILEAYVVNRSFLIAPIYLVLGLMPALGVGAAEEKTFYTLRIGDPRPELVARSLSDSQPIGWKDFEGEVAVVDFWATWCAPCVESFPKFNSLEKEFADRPVRFVSVTYEPESMIRPFLEKHPLDTPIAIDNDFHSFKSFKAWGIPAVYIFNPTGDLVSVIHPEKLDREVIETVLNGQVPRVKQSRGWKDPEGAEKHFRSLLD